MPMRTTDMPQLIGVIGLGTIGRSWARVFTRAGHSVIAYDPFATDAGDGITLMSSLNELAECVYVQESLPESVDLKRDMVRQIDAALPASVIIGSSSSAIPISNIVGAASHPERFLVAHPANPPHLLPVVEIVPGPATSEQATRIATDLMWSVGQRPVVLQREVSGFALNRLQYALFRECLRLVNDGVISVSDLDAVVTDGLGMRWAQFGPFAIEGINGASFRDNYDKFQGTIEALIDEAAAPVQMTPAKWEDLIAQSEAAYGNGSTAPLAARRDRWLHALADLKQRFEEHELKEVES
ncbi:3-hydroxyacyl-CoA dehydrogenase NAD-binding domain-containing protein [Microbacterium sp. A93]|uniref:3-hydroxyacyl-CoA dehydrogenase NAD-binding domain-containing protein n=1 Tax=Microbacterium sp. A93 TaxID=3450716 RepID=UPI003F434134